jgi:hypothetical protein
MSAGYGRISGELFAKREQDGSFSKTSEGCFLSMMDAPLVKFSQTWPKTGSMRSGRCFQSERPAAVISENGSSLWPTPKAMTGGANCNRDSRGAGGPDLQETVNSWASPAARIHKGGGNAVTRQDGKSRMDMLDWQAESWQTPRAADSQGAGWMKQKDGSKLDMLSKQAKKFQPTHQDQPSETAGQQSSKPRRTLNPLFVEWLMGWPPGWTDCGLPVTEFTRWLQLMRGELSTLK